MQWGGLQTREHANGVLDVFLHGLHGGVFHVVEIFGVPRLNDSLCRLIARARHIGVVVDLADPAGDRLAKSLLGHHGGARSF